MVLNFIITDTSHKTVETLWTLNYYFIDIKL